MADPSVQVPLPASVEQMLLKICEAQSQPRVDIGARRELASVGEKISLQILRTISNNKIRTTLSRYVVFMCRQNRPVPTQESVCRSPENLSSCSSSCSSPVNHPNGDSSHSPISKHVTCSPSSTSENTSMHTISPQLFALSKLEFRKSFLILSYLCRNRPEDLMTEKEILSWKDLPMKDFESKVWDAYGQRCCDETDRRKYSDWDCGKTHLYYCHIDAEGSYIFKGPYLKTTRTHLQRELGDDNVLIVKFEKEANDAYNKIAKEGILVGRRRYRFFVFKDGGREEKKDSISSSVKCYFVRVESITAWDEGTHEQIVHDARCLFMHAHTVSSMAKYMARFSLILSKTIKLQVDFSSLCIERIEDIPCRDENGCVVLGEDGEPLIHTDGTGFISEDLALKCPKEFYKAKYINDENFKRFLDCGNLEEGSLELRRLEARTKEPPLLMQVRLFNNGCAVKGTLLLNKKLQPRTIQIRKRSMVKVEADPILGPTRNSLEIVSVSHQPKKAFLSRHLIALLSHGGVPKEYFLDILTTALEDARNVYFNKRAALKVALNHGEIDDDFMAARMILSGIPLNEPCLQHRLSCLSMTEKRGLKGAKLPISESFYLMGTADPTGVLNNNEVCVILENGPLSGKLLVYRNPGLHFGDIHVLNAVYRKELDDVVGNAKYAIFFSTRGKRSVASEIANGDFDGDMYWVSRNPQLLDCFKESEPWKRIIDSSPDAYNRKPSDFSAEELEGELFQMFLSTRFRPSYNMSVAAHSWLSFMDRLLILGDANASEKETLTKTMLQLVDMYYDALDAPKSGKKFKIPNELKAEKYPHYMERGENSYKSTSILGLIYDKVNSYQSEDISTKEVWKLPSFQIEIPEACLNLWKERYDKYRSEMTKALRNDSESKNDFANEVIKKYKRLLYDAEELEESVKKEEDIFNEALAIYNVTYDYAIGKGDAKYCRFAWKVAGSALCKLYPKKQGEKFIVCSQSVLLQILK